MADNFAPAGGVCVVSCFYDKCEDMQKAVAHFGHACCVCFFEGEEMKFGMEYGMSVMKNAKGAGTCIAIVGDSGEEGKTQKTVEFPILEREGIKFTKMSLDDYKKRFSSMPDLSGGKKAPPKPTGPYGPIQGTWTPTQLAGGKWTGVKYQGNMIGQSAPWGNLTISADGSFQVQDTTSKGLVPAKVSPGGAEPQWGPGAFCGWWQTDKRADWGIPVATIAVNGDILTLGLKGRSTYRHCIFQRA
jgi:hypothetical protein